MKVVLLSGGIGSTAALHSALSSAQGEEVRAVVYSYGQAARDAELYAAQTIAKRAGVSCQTILLPEVPKSSSPTALNSLFVLRAFVEMSARPSVRDGERCILVLGCHKGPTIADRVHFPLSAVVQLGSTAGHDVVVPFAGVALIDVLRWCAYKPAMSALDHTYSCVTSDRRSCGVCDKCMDRWSAFRAYGTTDPWIPPARMTGGDPARDAALTR